MGETKLTKGQWAVLRALPDWIGVGLPAAVIGVTHAKLARLCARGLVEREKANEEWPYVYARTPAGNEALRKTS